MPRLPSLRLTRLSPSPRLLQNRTTPRPFSTYPILAKEQGHSESSTPDWDGRTTDDHVVNRTEQKDVQSESSHQAMKDKQQGKEGSQGISEKDEGNNNARAKKETKAPGPVIGMNDERGGKGW